MAQYSLKITDPEQFSPFKYSSYIYLEYAREPLTIEVDHYYSEKERKVLEYHAIVNGYKPRPNPTISSSKKIDVDVYCSPDEAEHQLISIVLRHNELTFAKEDYRIVLDFYLDKYFMQDRKPLLYYLRKSIIQRTLSL